MNVKALTCIFPSLTSVVTYQILLTVRANINKTRILVPAFLEDVGQK